MDAPPGVVLKQSTHVKIDHQLRSENVDPGGQLIFTFDVAVVEFSCQLYRWKKPQAYNQNQKVVQRSVLAQTVFSVEFGSDDAFAHIDSWHLHQCGRFFSSYGTVQLRPQDGLFEVSATLRLLETAGSKTTLKLH